MSNTESQYFCDCPRFCKQKKAVSRSTFFAHAKYRTTLTTDFNSFRASINQSKGNPSTQHGVLGQSHTHQSVQSQVSKYIFQLFLGNLTVFHMLESPGSSGRARECDLERGISSFTSTLKTILILYARLRCTMAPPVYRAMSFKIWTPLMYVWSHLACMLKF